MSRSVSMPRARRASIALVATSAVLLSAAVVSSTGVQAADDDEDILNPSWSDKIGQSIKNGMEHTTHMMGLGRPPGPPPSESPSGCPTITILEGTQSQRVMAPGATDNQGVRYQFSLFNVGRECSISGGRIVMKVGADGRVLLGPAGAAGRFDVPIRVVIYSDLAQKPIESKLYRVSASIPAGQTATPFQFVSDSLVVPLSSGQNGRDYSIKVGFDAKGTDAGKPARAARHGRRKATQATAAAAQ